MSFSKKLAPWITGTVVISGVSACFLSLILFGLPEISLYFAAMAAITIFSGSRLQFQFAKSKLHFSLSDVLLFYILLEFGITAAVYVAAFEAVFSSLALKRSGISVKLKTLALNASITTLSIFVAGLFINLIINNSSEIVRLNYTSLVELTLTLGLAEFAVNTSLIAFFVAVKAEKSVWSTWKEISLSFLLLYLLESAIAILSWKFIKEADIFLLAITAIIAAVVYSTYRRYVGEIRETSALAEQAERERAEAEKLRAEQAEKHVEELEEMIGEQLRISEELERSREEFRRAALHDELTELPNRNYFIRELSATLHKSKSNPKFKFAVLFFDLNRFKHINDSLGHSFGDQLLKQVARRLRTSVRSQDRVARFGGDEFAILLQGADREQDVTNFVERLSEKIAAPYKLKGRRIFTTASVGIALSNESYQEAENILRDADIAMYHSKQKNQSYAVFDQSMHAYSLNMLQIETDLQDAIKREEFCLYYQPVVDLEKIKPIGFEALIRWEHPKRGMVMPNDFIPIAENTGLIVPMTLWIIREACRQVKEWQEGFRRDLTLSINMSGKHFAKNELVEQVRRILDEVDFEPSLLRLEITESAVMEDAENAVKVLKGLKQLGVQISIDDFGTGYSSLSYLHKFPIDNLKIDRSFINTMENESENSEIVNTIITMAKSLRLEVVAEGIETLNQLHQLRQLDCEYGQGYLFSRPLPKEKIEKLLSDSNLWQDILKTQQHSFLPQFEFGDNELHQ